MKNIYYFDQNGNYLYMDTINADQNIPSNATTLVPEGLHPRFDGTKWNAMSREDFDKANPPMRPATPQTPSPADKALNALGLQLAETQKQLRITNQAVNALGLQFAKQQQGNTKNGDAQ
ncbi:hypothetical protein HMPREF0501_00437 [Limosilactobacillus coleohominis 101-4-CHN]|uniref:Uncharacterized protein n=1 Tax=Limosilactobacillus coleohominis 101-4-CHN TaxID=575594 RepID=C7XUS1_9LACO|nr:hypothetical protein [Limosilactobacillus coleohominis]EEU31032.1 hypothetical protein HMPREF0501_00437 [Limosilactobacillus coleohominis 101-4-CHN]